MMQNYANFIPGNYSVDLVFYFTTIEIFYRPPELCQLINSDPIYRRRKYPIFFAAPRLVAYLLFRVVPLIVDFAPDPWPGGALNPRGPADIALAGPRGFAVVLGGGPFPSTRRRWRPWCLRSAG